MQNLWYKWKPETDTIVRQKSLWHACWADSLRDQACHRNPPQIDSNLIAVYNSSSMVHSGSQAVTASPLDDVGHATASAARVQHEYKFA